MAYKSLICILKINENSKLRIICKYPTMIGRMYFFFKCVHTSWRVISSQERKSWDERGQGGREGSNSQGYITEGLSLPTKHTAQPLSHSEAIRDIHLRTVHQGEHSSTLLAGQFLCPVTYWPKLPPWAMIFPAPLGYGLLALLKLLGSCSKPRALWVQTWVSDYCNFYHSSHNRAPYHSAYRGAPQ